MLSALLGISIASEASFLNFAKTYNKKYATTEEYAKRREIFLNNYNDMLRHNQEYEEGKVSWWRKMTEDYDITHEEWMAKMNLGMPPLDESIMHNTVDEAMEARIKLGAAPDSWSWVDQGAITSIKDQVWTDRFLKMKIHNIFCHQKQCGSCAAFAAIAAIDTCFYFASNDLYDDLSEQHLMDCANGHYSYDDE